MKLTALILGALLVVLVFLISEILDDMEVDTVASSKHYLLIDAECKSRTIVTTQNQGESYAAFCERHDQEVDAAIARYGEKNNELDLIQPTAPRVPLGTGLLDPKK